MIIARYKDQNHRQMNYLEGSSEKADENHKLTGVNQDKGLEN